MRKMPIFGILLAALVIAAAAPALAEPVPAPSTGFDWRDLIDTDMDGDHVVGEEMCARPR
jgi:hypothetical protein